MIDFNNWQQRIITPLLPSVVAADTEKELLTQALVDLSSLEILGIAAEKLSSRDLYLFMGTTTMDASVLLPMLAGKIPNLEEELLRRVRARLEKLKNAGD